MLLKDQEKMYAAIDGRMAYDLDNTPQKEDATLGEVLMRLTEPHYHIKTAFSTYGYDKELQKIVMKAYEEV